MTTQQPQQPQMTPEQDIDITLVLKLSKVNVLIGALDELPHKFSRVVIDDIHKQAMAQLPKQDESGPSDGGLAAKATFQ